MSTFSVSHLFSEIEILDFYIVYLTHDNTGGVDGRVVKFVNF